MITPEERAAARRELIEARADGRVAAALEELSHWPTASCGCPLGRHHVPSCPRYVDVWRECPCPECSARRA